MTKDEFKKIRIEMRLSQQGMADFLGIKNGRSIRRFESGEWPVPKHAIKKIKEEKGK